MWGDDEPLTDDENDELNDENEDTISESNYTSDAHSEWVHHGHASIMYGINTEYIGLPLSSTKVHFTQKQQFVWDMLNCFGRFYTQGKYRFAPVVFENLINVWLPKLCKYNSSNATYGLLPSALLIGYLIFQTNNMDLLDMAVDFKIHKSDIITCLRIFQTLK